MSLQLAQSPFLGLNLIRLWALLGTRVSSQPALLLVMLEAALMHRPGTGTCIVLMLLMHREWYWKNSAAATDLVLEPAQYCCCCKLRELCSESAAVCSAPFCKERGKGCISKWGGGAAIV